MKSGIPYGIPQGSILGQIQYDFYMLLLGAIIQQYNISYYFYADDTGLYVYDLTQRITDIKYWITKNDLQHEEDKGKTFIF